MNDIETFLKSFIESFQEAWQIMDEIQKRNFVRKMLEDIDRNSDKDKGEGLVIDDKLIDKILESIDEAVDKQNINDENNNSENENDENENEKVANFLDVLSESMGRDIATLNRANPQWEGENILWTQNAEQFKKNLENFQENYPKKELVFSLPMGFKDFNELLSNEIRDIANELNFKIQDDLNPLSLLSKADYGKLIESYAREWVDEFNRQFIGDKLEIIDFNSLKNPIVKSLTNISEGRFLEYINETNLGVTETVCENYREWLNLNGIEIEGLGVIQEKDEVEIAPQNIPENNLSIDVNNLDGMNTQDREDVKGITDEISGLMNQGQQTQQKEQEGSSQETSQSSQTQNQSTQTQEETPSNPDYPNLSYFIAKTRTRLKDKSYSKAQFKADFIALCKTSNLNEKETEVLSALTRSDKLTDPQKAFVKEGYIELLGNKNARFERPIELLIKSQVEVEKITPQNIDEIKAYAGTLHSKPHNELRIAEKIILKDLKSSGALENTHTQEQNKQKKAYERFMKNGNKRR